MLSRISFPTIVDVLSYVVSNQNYPKTVIKIVDWMIKS